MIKYSLFITTILFDLDGEINLTNSKEGTNSDIRRRVSSTATLDGLSYVLDNGYSPSDSKLSFTFDNIEESIADNILRIVKYHSKGILSSQHGAFFITFSSATYSSGALRLSIIIDGEA